METMETNSGSFRKFRCLQDILVKVTSDVQLLVQSNE